LSRKLDPRPAITRAIVLDTAVSLFNSGGAAAVTADAIAERTKAPPRDCVSDFQKQG
jgi:AcrR family transcriptional regulator